MYRFGKKIARVHPERCTCRMCSKKKKKAAKEERSVIGAIYIIAIIVLGLAAL